MRAAFVTVLLAALLWWISVHELNRHGCWAATDFLGTNPMAPTFWCTRPRSFAFLVGSVVGTVTTMVAVLYFVWRLVRRGVVSDD